MSDNCNISLEEARAYTLEHLKPLKSVETPIESTGGLVVAQECVAQVDCPAAPSSLKDGYAVVSADLDEASAAHPVRLQVCGTMVAGGDAVCGIESGQAVKVMTGSRLPSGATAVLACEYTRETGAWVDCMRDAHPGRNVFRQGHDVTKGQAMARRGERLTPAKTGLLAAAGFATVGVHARPRVALIGIGDELVHPGQPLAEGQLYASNNVTLCSWLRQYHMPAHMTIVPDQEEALRQSVEQALGDNDVILTSGGAWMSDRDLTVRTLKEMGGQLVFHRIRLGPGKALAFILLQGKAVFCLPGGPPSNEMAFLQVVLPALHHLAGLPAQPFYLQTACLTQSVSGQADWTQFQQARLYQEDGTWCVTPLKKGSRLQSQANANALIEIPTGMSRLDQGASILVQVLTAQEPFSTVREK
jgi:molybdopterin molybdotransferase